MTNRKQQMIDETMKMNPPSTTLTKALVPQGAQTVTLAPEAPTHSYALSDDEQVEGADSLGREDLSIPVLKLVQAQSKNISEHTKHIGEFYNSLTGEFYQQVDGILMSTQIGRTAFPREYSADSEPLCGSADGLTPDAEFIGHRVEDTEIGMTIEIDGRPCVDCVLSKFGPNGETPLCAKGYTYAMVDVATFLPFVFRVQRSSLTAGRQLNTLAKVIGRKRVISIKSKMVDSPRGTYPTPVFMASGISEPEQVALVAEMSRAMGNLAAKVKAEPMAAPETNGGDNGTPFE